MNHRREPYDPWRDADDVAIELSCRVQQIGVAQEHGARTFRLNKCGVVVEKRGFRLVVKFDGEDKLARIRPHLVRVVRVLATAP